MSEQIVLYTPQYNELINFLIETDYSGSLSIDDYAKKVLENASFLTVIIDSQIKGMAIFYMNRPQKDFAYLTYIATNKDIRGKGYGKKLLEKAISIVSKNRYASFRLEVNLNNCIARKLYQFLGFKRIILNPSENSEHLELKF